jgi:hypothetical protein
MANHRRSCPAALDVLAQHVLGMACSDAVRRGSRCTPRSRVGRPLCRADLACETFERRGATSSRTGGYALQELRALRASSAAAPRACGACHAARWWRGSMRMNARHHRRDATPCGAGRTQRGNGLRRPGGALDGRGRGVASSPPLEPRRLLPVRRPGAPKYEGIERENAVIATRGGDGDTREDARSMPGRGVPLTTSFLAAGVRGDARPTRRSLAAAAGAGRRTG